MFLYSVPKFSNGRVVPTSHLFVDKIFISSAPPDDSLKKNSKAALRLLSFNFNYMI